MPTILIGGYYGAGNIGDEAILDSIVRELRSQYQNPDDLSLIVLSWDPDRTSMTHDVESIYWKDIDALLDAGLKSDLFILGGGGIFHDYWGIDPDTYLKKDFQDITAFGSVPLLAKLINVPCMIYAVGVGPFRSETAKEHTRIAFERCQVATVRDQESLRYLKETGFDTLDPKNPPIEVYPDPVFSLVTLDNDETEVKKYLKENNIPTGKILGISLRYWDIDQESEDWLSNVAEGISRFLETHDDIHCVLIPFHAFEATPFTNDVPTLKALAKKLDLPERVYVIEEQLSPRFAQALIKQCQMILGMRFHAIVYGINVATPTVALSYAPKVWSAMEAADLNAYCNRTISPNPEKLFHQLREVWAKRDAIHSDLMISGEKLKKLSKEHTRIALQQLNQSPSRELNLQQRFALTQTRRLFQSDTAYDQMREKLQRQVWDLQGELTHVSIERDQAASDRTILAMERDSLKKETDLLRGEIGNLRAVIAEIQSSNVWKLGQKYYHIRDHSPLKYLYWFAKIAKRDGFGSSFKNIRHLQRTFENPTQPRNEKVNAVFYDVIKNLNQRDLTGIALLTSAFEFDEFYNQRVINLAKYLTKRGWGVIFVAWVWHDENEAPPGEVLENLFQIPSNYFFEGYQTLSALQTEPKIFVNEFPHPDFLKAAIKLRRDGFKILYDIIDEWEAFHHAGQAIWYQQDIEESFVINANVITAVSQPLIEKFKHIRKDIRLVPNGFDPKVLGGHRAIAQRRFKHSEINLGYFGHLTPSWFDWVFLKEILQIATKRNLSLRISLIGYGEPDLDKTLGKIRDKIEFHGKVHPDELHKFVQDWDLAMIPFIHNELSEAVDPIKIYEYLYFGLPVIVKGIPHLESLPGVAVVRGAEEFMDALVQIRDKESGGETTAGLEAFTWEKRFTKLMGILEEESWMSL